MHGGVGLNDDTWSKQGPRRQHGLGFVACVIAYREDSILFECCLRRYVDSAGNGKCRAFVLGIDGNEDADMTMFEILQKVVWPRSICVS